MHLVQILLPTHDNEGVAFPRAHFDDLQCELTERYGGLTAHVRAPAEGHWQYHSENRTFRDDIVVYEVMVAALDREWWRAYREDVRARFRQVELIVRAQPIELL